MRAWAPPAVSTAAAGLPSTDLEQSEAGRVQTRSRNHRQREERWDRAGGPGKAQEELPAPTEGLQPQRGRQHGIPRAALGAPGTSLFQQWITASRLHSEIQLPGPAGALCGQGAI
ncbi:hypothetical protein CB1_000590033 [Camelus ferus]|nr:hypothetical protein CB1_000590033 [Camelus ferus]